MKKTKPSTPPTSTALTVSDLNRAFQLRVTPRGDVTVHTREWPTGDSKALPVYSTDTQEEAESIRERHCRRARDGSGTYTLNDGTVKDQWAIGEMFRRTHQEQLASMKTTPNKIMTHTGGSPASVTVGYLKPDAPADTLHRAEGRAYNFGRTQPNAPATADDPKIVLAGDLREGTGGMHVRVRVRIIDGPDAVCTLVRSGKEKSVRVATLRSSAYRLVERGDALARS